MELTGLIFAALSSAKKANERIDTLPLPMVFKGTLGTGGTISTLPTASSSNEGYVYIVITDGTYAGQSAKAGDTFVSDGSSWVLVPSGDEPSVIDDSVTSTALTWSSKKISDECKVKSFKYTGTGSWDNARIVFPSKPTLILSIEGMESNVSQFSTFTAFTLDSYGIGLANIRDTAISTYRAFLTKISDTELKISNPSGDAKWSMNALGVEYTVYYI